MGRENTKNTRRCPLCGERTDARFLRRHARLERRVARRLAETHDQWHREEGACARCVSWALRQEVERAEEGRHPAARPPLGRAGEILSLPARLRPDPNYRGRGVVVAFVDSDYVFHPDLLRPHARIATYVDARGPIPRAGARPPAPSVASWHGTMTAGSAFGSGWISGGRYPGIATSAKLVLVSIARPGGRIGDAQVFHGLRWVLEHHQQYAIRVVNLSVGGDRAVSSKRSRLDGLVARAVDEGIVVVAAAGNRPGQPSVPPASAPGAITVGGVNDFGSAEEHPEPFPGNCGPTVDGVAKPDLLAPSIWVPAPMVPGTPQAREAELLYELDASPDRWLSARLEERNDELRFPREVLDLPPSAIRGAIAMRMAQQKYISPFHQHVDGTSFAAAIVSAVVAQMLEANPNLRPEEVKACLRKTARPLEGVPSEIQGAGVLEAADAVEYARIIGGEDPTNPGFDSPELDEGRVVYRFVDPTARLRRVEWVGAIGGWNPRPMDRVAPGVFEHARPLPVPGRYPYKFLLPDGRWVADARNPLREADGFGGWNSLLVVRRR